MSSSVGLVLVLSCMNSQLAIAEKSSRKESDKKVGFRGLHWGDSEDRVLKLWPNASRGNGGNLVVGVQGRKITGEETIAGMPATFEFHFEEGKLVQVDARIGVRKDRCPELPIELTRKYSAPKEFREYMMTDLGGEPSIPAMQGIWTSGDTVIWFYCETWIHVIYRSKKFHESINPVRDDI